LTRTVVLAERRTIVAASGHAVRVERRRIGRPEQGAELPSRTGQTPLSLAERIMDVACRLERLAGPSRTRPHLFTETKSDLAEELRQCAAAAR